MKKSWHARARDWAGKRPMAMYRVGQAAAGILGLAYQHSITRQQAAYEAAADERRAQHQQHQAQHRAQQQQQQQQEMGRR